jgi:hypothetical protein
MKKAKCRRIGKISAGYRKLWRLWRQWRPGGQCVSIICPSEINSINGGYGWLNIGEISVSMKWNNNGSSAKWRELKVVNGNQCQQHGEISAACCMAEEKILASIHYRVKLGWNIWKLYNLCACGLSLKWRLSVHASRRGL